MLVEMRLPQFDMLDSDATILKWLKAEGDRVAEGESILEVETSKAAAVLEAPAAGVLARIQAQPGVTVTSGAVLAVIDSD